MFRSQPGPRLTTDRRWLVPTYQIALFLHIVGALGLFAGLALEWVTLSALRRITTIEQAREWSTIYRTLRAIGPASLGLLLVFGLYMMATAWGLTPWVGLGILSLVAIAALGAFNGVQLSRTLDALSGSGALPASAMNVLRRSAFVISLRLRIALGLSVVLLMTIKPDLLTALASIAVALALAIASAGLGERPAVVRVGQRT